LKDGYIKASVRTLFEKVEYQTDVNLLRSYEELKKNIRYLIDNKHISNKTTINDDDTGDSEAILNRVWKFYPTEKRMEELNSIAVKRLEYKNGTVVKLSYTPDEIKKIMDDRGLSSIKFAEVSGIGRDILSKFLNGKTKRLSRKITDKINQYLKTKGENNV
jgi:DNA-binding Xre family transcriptional regulator